MLLNRLPAILRLYENNVLPGGQFTKGLGHRCRLTRTDEGLRPTPLFERLRRTRTHGG